MKTYLILHYGFEKPTAEEMTKWKKWFNLIKDCQVDRGGLRGGLKITDSGTEKLPFGKDSLTGYTIIHADNLEKAEDIASQCPVVNSTQMYEIHKS
jgi:hypothetical protein